MSEKAAEGTWEIVVCLECGAISPPGFVDDCWAVECDASGGHGPTKTVSVLPASISTELAETMARIANIDWSEPPAEMPDEIARPALARYREQVSE